VPFLKSQAGDSCGASRLLLPLMSLLIAAAQSQHVQVLCCS
jgi:hypothetical protein